MTKSPVHLPYFDCILERLGQGDAEVSEAFSRHVHWGYWDNPSSSDGSLADFALAADRLARRVCTAVGATNNQRILDVGCGFGGTLGCLNDRLTGVELVGVNIDARQLARARNLIAPRAGNRAFFVTADACDLPFPDAVFDAIVVVEAIFHFPSRARFFREARRVLRPGGRLALCDFVPRFIIPWLWDHFERSFKPTVNRLYGPSDMRCTLADYRRLARQAGFRLVRSEDITSGTLPTYRVLRPLIRRIAPDPQEAEQVVARVEFTTRIGLLRYLVLSFE